MTIHWKAVEQYFTVVLFVFQCNPGCNFWEFINFDLVLFGVKEYECAKCKVGGRAKQRGREHSKVRKFLEYPIDIIDNR